MLQNASYMFFFKKRNKTKQNDYKKKKKEKVSMGRSVTRDIRRQQSRRV